MGNIIDLTKSDVSESKLLEQGEITDREYIIQTIQKNGVFINGVNSNVTKIISTKIVYNNNIDTDPVYTLNNI